MTPGARLRRLVAEGAPLAVMSAHSPLSAKLAAEAGFEAVWASGFELAALYGVPDAGVVSASEHLDMTRRMAALENSPCVIADLDTGFGNALNAAHAVRDYARAGAAAVVIEDKVFPKMTSLRPGGRQDLIRVEEYVGKLGAALDARTDDMLVIGRTEALIAGLGVAAALDRAEAYAESGADMILVHSKAPDPSQIMAVIDGWSGRVPLVIVPTAFPAFGITEAAATGKVGLVLFANHAIRASVQAMRDIFARVLRDGSGLSVEDAIATVAEIFALQDMGRAAEIEARFLR